MADVEDGCLVDQLERDTLARLLEAGIVWRARKKALEGTGWAWEWHAGSWRARQLYGRELDGSPILGARCEVLSGDVQIVYDDGYDPATAPLEVVRAVLEHHGDPGP